jgi:hypothetical protein
MHRVDKENALLRLCLTLLPAQIATKQAELRQRKTLDSAAVPLFPSYSPTCTIQQTVHQLQQKLTETHATTWW